mmetsp:Transcript_26158/g.26392  ORF Transcript_26158/g.26392 Transcript_26158/m.26392 type:complete len:241 (+) Transcript_26158:30-752(+)
MSSTMIAVFTVVLLVSSTMVHAFRSPNVPRKYMKMDMISDSALKKTAAGVISLFLIAPPAVQLPPMIQPVFAEFRAAQKRTYFRFTPKMAEGRDYYKNDLKKAIDSEDWATVVKLFEEYVTKYNENFKDQVDATDTYVNFHFYRPMVVLSGSFAERGSSPKQRAMLEKEAQFEAAMRKLEGAVRPIKGDGFFAGMIQPPTGAAKKQQALEGWSEGKEAFNEFISTMNFGLMKEVNPMDLM